LLPVTLSVDLALLFLIEFKICSDDLVSLDRNLSSTS
jgi:hypothetical protein